MGYRSHRYIAAVVAAIIIICLVWPVILTPLAADRGSSDPGLARTILGSLGERGGLCVRLGVQDGSLAAGLSDGGRYLVHGLGASREAINRARKTIAAAGLEGAVSVEVGSVDPLPYADNLVSLIVVDDLAGLLKKGLKLDEALRVLRPNGVAWLGQRLKAGTTSLRAEALRAMLTKAGLKKFEIVENRGVWAKYVKPRPESMDEWTHGAYDSTGNPVSKEDVDVPSGVRWAAGPCWPTGDRKSSVPSVVVSAKRLIYLFEDELATPDGPKRELTLNARDAYNGLMLWKRRGMPRWFLVSSGDRIFTVVKEGGPLVALNAATGELVHTYEETENPRRILCVSGSLVLSLPEGLCCLDAESGAVKWKHEVRPREFVAGDGRIFVHLNNAKRGGGSQITCVDLGTGEEKWSAATSSWSKSAPNLLFYQEGILVFATQDANHGVSARDGSHLWQYTYPRIGHGGSFTKVLSVGGLVWVHNAGTKEEPGYRWEGLDPVSGEVKKTLPHPQIIHRCCIDVATARYLVCGSMDTVNHRTGEHKRVEAARNSCRNAAVRPANGLIYTFPHACRCFSLLRGFLAVVPTGTPAFKCTIAVPESTSSEAKGSAKPATVTAEEAAANRLEKGPAYGQKTSGGVPAGDEWATWRGNARRSGSAAAPGPGALNKLWERAVPVPISPLLSREWKLKDSGDLSSPVIAEGKVFAGVSDGHQVLALDAATGNAVWSYTAGGRVDCAPTIYKGLCLFGARDGWVYCLRSKDGKLIWRFRAAPGGRRIVAYGQLESPWPVVGGVLVFDGLVYVGVGRHSGSDGGLYVQCLEPETGRLVWATRPQGYSGVSDVLNGEGQAVQMASWQFDAKTGANTSIAKARLRGGRLGLLNNAWYKRPIALRGGLQRWTADRNKSGQMLSFNESATTGFRASRVSGRTGELSGGSELFAIPEETAGPKQCGPLEGWSIEMHTEARVKGMVLTPERLYVAGRLYHARVIENAESYDMGNGNFTVSIGFKTTQNGTLLSKSPRLGGWGSGAKGIFIAGGKVVYVIDELGRITSERAVNDDKWRHVVLTDRNGETRLYIDGKLDVGKEKFTKPDTKGHVLRVADGSVSGRTEDGWRFGGKFKGEIREVRYFDKSVDDATAMALSAGQETPAAKPVLTWKPAPGPEKVSELPNVVRIYSVADGEILGEYPVKEEFVHDCLAVSGDRLYVSTRAGKLVCLGEK